MSTTLWTPPPGRHEVQVGTSLAKSLRARKGIAPAPKRSSNIPDKEFFALRYNFKPSSVDSSRPATLHKDSANKLVVEHPSTNPDEAHVFLGEEIPAKEWLCVLVFDEHTQCYTLEKVESSIGLNLDRRSSATRPNNTGTSKPHQEEVPAPPPQREEEEEEPEHEIPIQHVTELKPQQQAAVPPPPVKAAAPPVKAAPPPPVKAAPKPVKPPQPQKRPPEPLSDADEEVMEFGHDTKRVKRTPPTPETSSWLELPGESSSYAQPLADPISAGIFSESEEDDWDPVEPQALPSQSAVEEAEEIDVEEFADMLNQTLEEEPEDFLAAAVSPEPDSQPMQQPMSLRAMAGEVSEEEYSSSDDSDDD